MTPNGPLWKFECLNEEGCTSDKAIIGNMKKTMYQMMPCVVYFDWDQLLITS